MNEDGREGEGSRIGKRVIGAVFRGLSAHFQDNVSAGNHVTIFNVFFVPRNNGEINMCADVFQRRQKKRPFSPVPAPS